MKNPRLREWFLPPLTEILEQDLYTEAGVGSQPSEHENELIYYWFEYQAR